MSSGQSGGLTACGMGLESIANNGSRRIDFLLSCLRHQTHGAHQPCRHQRPLSGLPGTNPSPPVERPATCRNPNDAALPEPGPPPRADATGVVPTGRRRSACLAARGRRTAFNRAAARHTKHRQTRGAPLAKPAGSCGQTQRSNARCHPSRQYVECSACRPSPNAPCDGSLAVLAHRTVVPDRGARIRILHSQPIRQATSRQSPPPSGKRHLPLDSLPGLAVFVRPASLSARHPPRRTVTSAPRSSARIRAATWRLTPQFSSPQ